MQNPTISSFLWFEAGAEEAVRLYACVFGEHCRVSGTRFELFGQRYIAFNGGSTHRLSDAFSIMVECETQAEIDRYWEALIVDGGTESRCGWLRDRFGLSWQIIPSQLYGLLHHPDPEKGRRVLQAMLAMTKLDLAVLEGA